MNIATDFIGAAFLFLLARDWLICRDGRLRPKFTIVTTNRIGAGLILSSARRETGEVQMIKRMQLRSGAALIAAAMLGSCGGGGGAVVALEPGEWEMTMRVTNVRTDNMPPAMREDMRRMGTNRTQTARNCMTVTADVVRIQNLRFPVPTFGRPGGNCRIAELSMEGGRIRAEMSCDGLPAPATDGSGTMSMSGEMNGTYTARSLDVTGRGEVRFGANNGGAEFRITGRRLGACPAPRPYMGPPPTVMVPRPTPPGAMRVPDTYSPPAENMAANAM